jgi:hypothetical protein
MVKFLSIIVCFFVALHSVAQDRIDAERPGESKSPELVKGNHLQVETGLRSEKIADRQFLYQHPSIAVRYGLFNAIELRMDVVSQTIRDNIQKESLNGFKPFQFGLKAKVLPENKWSPSIALLGMVGIPSTSSVDFYNRRLPIEFRTLFANTISGKIKLQYNAGLKWEGEDRSTKWMYSVSPVFKISDNFNLFVEEYAYLKKTGSAQHYLDGGLEFFPNRSLMLDLSGGVGLSDLSSSYFVAAGVSFRLPVR